MKAIGFPGITIIHKPKRQVSVTLKMQDSETFWNKSHIRF